MFKVVVRLVVVVVVQSGLRVARLAQNRIRSLKSSPSMKT